jgi:hypothetical protein
LGFTSLIVVMAMSKEEYVLDEEGNNFHEWKAFALLDLFASGGGVYLQNFDLRDTIKHRQERLKAFGLISKFPGRRHTTTTLKEFAKSFPDAPNCPSKLWEYLETRFAAPGSFSAERLVSPSHRQLDRKAIRYVDDTMVVFKPLLSFCSMIERISPQYGSDSDEDYTTMPGLVTESDTSDSDVD